MLIRESIVGPTSVDNLEKLFVVILPPVLNLRAIDYAPGHTLLDCFSANALCHLLIVFAILFHHLDPEPIFVC